MRTSDMGVDRSAVRSQGRGAPKRRPEVWRPRKGKGAWTPLFAAGTDPLRPPSSNMQIVTPESIDLLRFGAECAQQAQQSGGALILSPLACLLFFTIACQAATMWLVWRRAWNTLSDTPLAWGVRSEGSLSSLSTSSEDSDAVDAPATPRHRGTGTYRLRRTPGTGEAASS
jgi:hypothetical protein